MTDRLIIYATESAYWHNVTVREIMGRGRSHSVVAARKAVMRQLRADGFSTSQIGRWMGRDHSTVVHATRRQN